MKEGTSTSSSGSLAVAAADGRSEDEYDGYDPDVAGGADGGAGGSVAPASPELPLAAGRPKPEASRRAVSGVRGGGALYDGAAGGRVPAWGAGAGAGGAGRAGAGAGAGVAGCAGAGPLPFVPYPLPFCCAGGDAPFPFAVRGADPNAVGSSF